MDRRHRSTDWDAFPVSRMRTRTFAKRAVIHADLVAATLRRARGGVLEVGIGSAAQSGLLSRLASPVVSVDNQLRILQAARPNAVRYGRGLALAAADGFRLPFRDGSFGVALSQGLMEHFGDREVGELLREQLRVCRSVVFNVPSDRYPRRDLGDERLLAASAWRRIVEAGIDRRRYHVRCRGYRLDVEAIKYSLLARRWLGGFSVLATIDPR